MTLERLGRRTNWQEHRKMNCPEAINGWRQERTEFGTFAEALE